MRPRTLDEIVGQDALLGTGRPLRLAIEAGEAGSLLLWGPPGVGKTTLARILAERSRLVFVPFSAVLSGIKEVREALHEASARRARGGAATLLFVDEIHRFNKAQQDAFLAHVENGDIVLVGATTENPAFAVNAALLSRCRVVQLVPLDDEALTTLVDRALADEERGLGRMRLTITPAARARLALFGGGDARKVLAVLEAAATLAAAAGATIDVVEIAAAAQQRVLAHDKDGDRHFDLLSAFHKSLRNSDADASLYWLARFCEAGADPLQAARRMIAMAAEDIGLADPMALQVATGAMLAFERLGLPEGRLPLAEAAIYLATAPKSRGVASAIDAAVAAVRDGKQHDVPLHLRNAPTRLAKELGHGAEYRFAPDEPGHVADMDCLPDALAGTRFYRPGDWGFEQKVRERLDDIARRRGQR
ncbi:MAG: replication-associated recombination protein A [Planctomycetes bacterium]|nr:replication-associated recombination protein A [Planctomycetota bacterium]